MIDMNPIVELILKVIAVALFAIAAIGKAIILYDYIKYLKED